MAEKKSLESKAAAYFTHQYGSGYEVKLERGKDAKAFYDLLEKIRVAVASGIGRKLGNENPMTIIEAFCACLQLAFSPSDSMALHLLMDKHTFYKLREGESYMKSKKVADMSSNELVNAIQFMIFHRVLSDEHSNRSLLEQVQLVAASATTEDGWYSILMGTIKEPLGDTPIGFVHDALRVARADLEFKAQVDAVLVPDNYISADASGPLVVQAFVQAIKRVLSKEVLLNKLGDIADDTSMTADDRLTAMADAVKKLANADGTASLLKPRHSGIQHASMPRQVSSVGWKAPTTQHPERNFRAAFDDQHLYSGGAGSTPQRKMVDVFSSIEALHRELSPDMRLSFGMNLSANAKYMVENPTKPFEFRQSKRTARYDRQKKPKDKRKQSSTAAKAAQGKPKRGKDK